MTTNLIIFFSLTIGPNIGEYYTLSNPYFNACTKLVPTKPFKPVINIFNYLKIMFSIAYKG